MLTGLAGLGAVGAVQFQTFTQKKREGNLFKVLTSKDLGIEPIPENEYVISHRLKDLLPKYNPHWSHFNPWIGSIRGHWYPDYFGRNIVKKERVYLECH